MWFMYICCPSKQEKDRRKAISTKRKERMATYIKHEEKMIEETEKLKRERLQREQKDRYMSAEARAEAIRQNPLGYNIDNRKCHNRGEPVGWS
jgi:hypothetical protein